MTLDLKGYRRDCLLGTLGALLMLTGDLCLSVIPAHTGDSGLFAREYYLSGAYEPWRLPLLISYAGMFLLILGSAYAVLTGKTVLPWRMFVFHQLVWQLVFVLIPDIRQLLGAEVSTWDFVLSQGSGNAALCIWMAANAVWAKRQMKTEEVK